MVTPLISLDAAGPTLVRGDPVQLRQAVTNLVSNALVHTDLPATVTVEVNGSGETVVLVVRDTGAGLAAEDVERAFDRFWRAPVARSRRGSGLGLPLVRGIVEAHAGQIAVRNAIGDFPLTASGWMLDLHGVKPKA